MRATLAFTWLNKYMDMIWEITRKLFGIKITERNWGKIQLSYNSSPCYIKYCSYDKNPGFHFVMLTCNVSKKICLRHYEVIKKWTFIFC